MLFPRRETRGGFLSLRVVVVVVFVSPPGDEHDELSRRDEKYTRRLTIPFRRMGIRPITNSGVWGLYREEPFIFVDKDGLYWALLGESCRYKTIADRLGTPVVVVVVIVVCSV